MSRKGILIGLAAAFLAGIVVSSAYFYFGPYGGLSYEHQQLMQELKAKQASESAMQKSISQLKVALEKTEVKLAKQTRLVEDLQAKMERPIKRATYRKPKKELVLAEVAKPATAGEQSRQATAQRPVIGRSAIALGVKNREPVGISERVSIDQQRVYCWLHVVNAEGEEITVRWINKGQRIGESHLPVGSNSWRTWSYVTLNPSMIGPAQVEILDENGNTLQTLSFEIAG